MLGTLSPLGKERMSNVVFHLRRTARTASCFVRQLALLLAEVPVVWFFMAKLKANALPNDHAWVSGKISGTDADIWPRNIVYRSPVRSAATAELSDDDIATRTGEFLSRMVARSTAPAEIPYGPKRRMPHAVNYIHGSVHYNGLFLIFDDFLDVVRHLSDSNFRADLLKLGKTEQREITLLIRTRQYDPLEFAYCVGAVRCYLPWFSNGNGPSKKPVLWGNMAPYPAVNLINGAWISDIQKLWRKKLDQLARPPSAVEGYFKQPVIATQHAYRFIDRLQAWYMYTDVRLRGFRGQLFFASRKRIEPHRIQEYHDAGGYGRWAACHKVPFPRLRRVKHASSEKAS
jgi:hypothetical protein